MGVIASELTFASKQIGTRILRAFGEVCDFDQETLCPFLDTILNEHLEQVHPYFTEYNDHGGKRVEGITPCALFLPADVDSMSGQRSYVVFNLDGRGLLEARRYPYIPGGESFLKQSFLRDARKRGIIDEVTSMPPSERMDKMLERGSWDSPDKRFKIRVDRKFNSLAALLMEGDVSFDAQMACTRTADRMGQLVFTSAALPHVLEKLAELPKSGSSRDFERVIENFRYDARVRDAMTQARHIKADIVSELTQYELTENTDPLAAFSDRLDPEIICVLAEAPGRETASLYNALRPLKRVSRVERDQHGVERIRPERNLYEVDTDRADKRRTAIRTYPLLASLKGIEDHLYSDRGNPDAVMSTALNISMGSEETARTLKFLKGKTEKDIPRPVATLARRWAGYLSFIEGDQNLPYGANDWVSFSEATKMDHALYDLRLIMDEGDFMAEIEEAIDEAGSWEKALAMYGNGSDGFRHTVDNIQRFESLVGVSAIAPTLLRLAKTWDEQGFIAKKRPEKSLFALCRIADSGHRSRFDRETQKMISATDGVSFPGLIFNGYPIRERALNAQCFMTHKSELEKWRRELALTDYMASFGMQAQWQPLPMISEEERRRDQMIHKDGGMMLTIAPLSSAKDLFLVSAEMRATPFELMSDVAFARAHYVRVHQPGSEKLVGIAMLKEVSEEGGPVELAYVRKWGPYNDDFDMPNSFDESIEAAVRIYNARQMDPEPFEDARESLLSRIENHATSHMIVGHDWENPEHNAQFLRIVSGYLPGDLIDQLKADPMENQAYGAISVSAVTDNFRHMLRAGGMLHEMPAAVLHPYAW